MAKKEENKRHPERDLAAIIVLAALLFATASFTKNNFTSPAMAGTGIQALAVGALPGSGFASDACSLIPLVTYTLLLLMVIVLITYLLRRHICGHVLHTNWVYALYAMLILNILLTALEYFACQKTLYPAVFAIAAIIAVFILDALLVMMPKKKTLAAPVLARPAAPALPKQKESIFEKLRGIASAKPAQPGEKEIAELRQVIRELKELKKR